MSELPDARTCIATRACRRKRPQRLEPIRPKRTLLLVTFFLLVPEARTWSDTRIDKSGRGRRRYLFRFARCRPSFGLGDAGGSVIVLRCLLCGRLPSPFGGNFRAGRCACGHILRSAPLISHDSE